MMGIYPSVDFEDMELSFYGKPRLIFLLEAHDIVLPIADPLYDTARVQRTFGPDKVKVQQCLPSGRAIYYLRVSVLPYQPI